MVVVENVIEYERVMDIVKGYTHGDYVTTKRMLLRELRLPDTKDTRRLLTKVMKDLKEHKLVRTDYAVGDNGQMCGKGYVLYDY